MKKPRHEKRGIQSVHALFLAQSLISNMHDKMTKSHLQEILSTTQRVIEENNGRSETVLTGCFTTLNVSMIFSPKLTIDILSRSGFFMDFVAVLNKKLITICLTPYDRKALVLGLISLLRNTMGTEAFSRVNHSEIFKFCFYLLDYHQILSMYANEPDRTDKLSLSTQTRYGNLQKSILHLELVREDETVLSGQANPKHKKRGMEEEPNTNSEQKERGSTTALYNEKDNPSDDSMEELPEDADSLAASYDSNEDDNFADNNMTVSAVILILRTDNIER